MNLSTYIYFYVLYFWVTSICISSGDDVIQQRSGIIWILDSSRA